MLNGPHTKLSPVAYLSGINIVREACEHEVGKYIHKVMFDELMETLNLPKEELKKFAEDVWSVSTIRLLITGDFYHAEFIP